MNFDIPHIINYFHMKKNVLSNILFFFFLFLVSCAGEKQVVNNVYPILDLDQAIPVDSIKFSDIFDSAKIITFDKSSQALIGDVNRVEIVDDYIFVLDRNIAKTVFTFDDQGRFLRKIGAVGQGKGEYTSPFDFTLDKEKKHIFILDRQQKKVHKYDYSTGKHLSSINIPKFSTNILYYKDVGISFCHNIPFLVVSVPDYPMHWLLLLTYCNTREDDDSGTNPYIITDRDRVSILQALVAIGCV